MMTTVKIHEAKTQLSRLLTIVEAGGEFVIARGSKPIAKLVPFSPRAKRVSGLYSGQVTIPDDVFAPMSDEELADWYDGPVFPE